MRVAIVGQGPRGIQALFALADVVRGRRAGADLDVTCFDPQTPGFGAAYATDQPDCLRLNVRPDIVDLPGCPTFVAWLKARGLPTTDTPRSLVGAYLDEMRQMLLRRLPQGMRVTTVRASVDSLERDGQGWLVIADGVAAPGRFDEVLLAVGHAQPDHERLFAGMLPATSAGVRVISSAYPASAALSRSNVPPGRRVLVRGAALTFIDIALLLGTSRDERERPRVVIPTSRSGLLMNTKPLPLCPPSIEDTLVEDVVHLISPGPTGVLAAPRALAWKLLATLDVADPRGFDEVVRAVLDDDPAGRPRTVTAQERLRASIALAEAACLVDVRPREDRAGEPVNTDGNGCDDNRSLLHGSAAPNRAPHALTQVPFECLVEWALGRAWALLYPRIGASTSWHDGAVRGEWAEFQRQSARYERLTFGPTLPQARRLLALCDSGIVDTSWLDSRRTLDAVQPSRWGEFADVVVDGVLAPPGVAGNDRPLVAALIAHGHLIAAVDGRRGLLIDEAAQCLDAAGRPTLGLSAVGRFSEDVVVGHDTLNRHAHPHLARWARRIGDRA